MGSEMCIRDRCTPRQRPQVLALVGDEHPCSKLLPKTPLSSHANSTNKQCTHRFEFVNFSVCLVEDKGTLARIWRVGLWKLLMTLCTNLLFYWHITIHNKLHLGVSFSVIVRLTALLVPLCTQVSFAPFCYSPLVAK